jgi:type II secretion system protein I
MEPGVLMPNRRGFTLIELLMALGILTAVLMALGVASGHFIREATLSERRTAALELADSRIDEIQMFPVYPALDTTFAGSETGFATLSGYIRTTAITHVGGLGQKNDYKRITVTVIGPGVNPPVSRTITVAAP